jgi:diguanylate cyclase (GGDEF)-like protein
VRAQEAAGATRGIVLPLGFALGALAILVWSSFHRVGVPAIVLATGSLLVIMGRLALTWRDNSRLLRASREEAVTDALTGLGNRRAMATDLERRFSTDGTLPFTLVMFDLDGFKQYNDSYGHPAGDALLQRLGHKLRATLNGADTAYRMGGDEFCALLDGIEPDIHAVAAALIEHGDGFRIGCSYGSVRLPNEADSPETALRIADQRMYTRKRSGSTPASRQSKAVLLRALAERSPALDAHLRDVAILVSAVAARFGLAGEAIDEICHAAELHDVGKVAVPDTILDKPGPLDESDWAFVRRHPVIGERIIAAAPDLVRVATLVRSSQERFDGNGYPDGLAGDEIPIGSRIIAACDAFDAMTSDRPYRRAMDEAAAIAELQRCAGTQFDPVVVERLCEALDEQRLGAERAA